MSAGAFCEGCDGDGVLVFSSVPGEGMPCPDCDGKGTAEAARARRILSIRSNARYYDSCAQSDIAWLLSEIDGRTPSNGGSPR